MTSETSISCDYRKVWKVTTLVIFGFSSTFLSLLSEGSFSQGVATFALLKHVPYEVNTIPINVKTHTLFMRTGNNHWLWIRVRRVLFYEQDICAKTRLKETKTSPKESSFLRLRCPDKINRGG